MADRTQLYLQSQWNEIEKEIKAHTYKAANDAMVERARAILADYRDYTSYETRTGNMDASIMAGFFRSGRLARIIRYTNRKPAPYLDKGWKSDKRTVSFDNRYGGVTEYSYDSGLGGDAVSEKFLQEYSSTGYQRRFELVVVGEMFYRYALESKGYLDFFTHLESQYNEEAEKLKKEIDLKRRIGTAMLKNVRLGK